MHDDHGPGVDALEPWIAPSLRVLVEDRYWAPIERLTGLDAMVADPAFVADPGAHISIYSDHGPNHARDVAARAASISSWAVGTLVPERSDDRAAFVTGAAVLLSLLHDVGMCVDPPVGRRLHAQYGSQLVFTPGFADVLDELLRTDAGLLDSGLTAHGVAAADRREVAAEVLACAVAHSKSTVPAPVLDDPAGFRSLLQYVRHTQLLDQQPGRTLDSDRGTFAWLTDARYAALTADVVDAIRIVRAADALRQRGTTLRTSSGFEVVVDARTGCAATVVRSASRRSAFLLEIGKPISIGEANIRGAEIDPHEVRFHFHRGDLASPEIADRVADATASVVDDIQRDILPSFPSRDLAITLVAPADDPTFAERVRGRFVARRPELDGRVDVVPGAPIPTVPPRFDWVGRGRPVEPAMRDVALADMEARGLRVVHTADEMFDGVVAVDLAEGEAIIAPGEDASFAVVATGPGLVVTPLGGYDPVAAQPWIPVGTVGVLRGHDRNSLVTASRPLEVLVIPADVFLAHWAEPYDAAALVARVLERSEP